VHLSPPKLKPLGGKAAAGFVERCVSYIGENAVECVKTNSFLSLPKEAVLKLISSDYVSKVFNKIRICS
jgi:hypothetical protein